MGIDGIGKGPGPAPPVAPSEGGATGPRPAEPSRSFRIEPTDVGSPGDAARAAGPSAAHATERVAAPEFERVRSGELHVGEYLDAKVRDATAHLVGLPEANLAR